MYETPLDIFSEEAAALFPTEEPGNRDRHDPYAALQASQDLREFVRLAWPVVEPATPFVAGWHIDAVCEHLTAVTRGHIRNLLINMPPRHMKSLAVGVFWPAWVWTTAPHRRWLFSSYALSLSERDSLRCRRLIESPWYRKHWGNRFVLCGDQNTKLRDENDRGGHRIAVSVGSAATGQGGDYVVVDDPHNVIDRESDAKRLATLAWWDETMCTRLNDPKTGSKVIVMQRIHEKDLSGHVLAQGGYAHLNLPAEFESARRCVIVIEGGLVIPTPVLRYSEEPDRMSKNPVLRSTSEPASTADVSDIKPLFSWSDPRTTDGELLWRDRVGDKEIADFKVRLGPEGYAGQFQQRPAPAGGGRFKAEWFRYYRVSDGPEIALVPPAPSPAEASGDETQPPARAPAALTESLESSTFPARIASSECGVLYTLLQPDGSSKTILANDCNRVAVMDPAGTEPGEGRRPCYTVIQVWDITPIGEMALVYQYRRQVQAPDAATAAVKICREYDVAYIAIEKDGMGLGVVQHVRRENIAVRAIKARGSKEARSQTAEIRMAAGSIYFPVRAPFLFELENELLQFPNSEYADQVDALSHAAILVQKMGRSDVSATDEMENAMDRADMDD